MRDSWTDWVSDPRVAVFRTSSRAASERVFEEALSSLLGLLGLPAGRFGDRSWNPFAGFIEPGDTVLVKPNLIRESHLYRDEWEQVVTDPRLIEAVVDLASRALGGRGRLIVADGPQTDSDFDVLCRVTGLRGAIERLRARGAPVELLDLRQERWIQKGEVIVERQPLRGDPAGTCTIDLGPHSLFHPLPPGVERYGADYDVRDTASFHTGRHAYVVCRTALDADVVINLPKMKTHKKTGVTLSLKNLVGVNGYRNCLPHHTLGVPAAGGDEFPDSAVVHRLEGRSIAAFKRALVSGGGRGGAWARTVKRIGRVIFGDTRHVVRSGNWHGNDTAWRMVLDLNRAALLYGGDGRPRSRRYLTIVDGIVAGEGDGPVAADAKRAGLLVGGFNPVAVDSVCATLMGFDWRRLKVIAQAWERHPLPLVRFEPAAVRCRSNEAAWSGTLSDLETAPHLGFRPHFGWVGAIERSPLSMSA